MTDKIETAFIDLHEIEKGGLLCTTPQSLQRKSFIGAFP